MTAVSLTPCTSSSLGGKLSSSTKLLRGSANRRVAYVSRNNGKAVESLLELPSMKSCQPIGGSSKKQVARNEVAWTVRALGGDEPANNQVDGVAEAEFRGRKIKALRLRSEASPE